MGCGSSKGAPPSSPLAGELVTSADHPYGIPQQQQQSHHSHSEAPNDDQAADYPLVAPSSTNMARVHPPNAAPGGDNGDTGNASFAAATTAGIKQSQQPQQQLQPPQQLLPQQLQLPPPSSQPPSAVAVDGGQGGSTVNGTANPQHVLAIPNTEAQWKELWDALSPHLLDPADVHAVMQERMNATTNLLSAAEVNFTLRRIRHVVRSLPPSKANSTNPISQPGKMVGRVFATATNSNSNADVEAKATAERYHVLTQHVLKRCLAPLDIPSMEYITSEQQQQQPQGGKNSAAAVAAAPPVDPIHAAYILMLHLSESLWDRSADIAVQVAQKAGLEMDVNKGRNFSKLPPSPNTAVAEEPLQDLPPGISVQSYVFLMALALRGTREQRIQLLFYLMVSPKTLAQFLATHPAGGVPFWLLEVGGDVVFSLASMAHYHLYGRPFLPASIPQHNPLGATTATHAKPLKIVANATQDLLGWLLKPPPSSSQGLDSADTGNTNHNKLTSPPRSKPQQNRRFSSGNNSEPDMGEESFHGKTEIMERLQEVAEGRPSALRGGARKEDPAMEASRRKFLMAMHPMNGKTVYWSIDEFAFWANQALDEIALETIMHRLFATGILPSFDMERDIVQSRWLEWQLTASHYFTPGETEGSTMDLITQSVRKILDQCQNGGIGSSPLAVNGKKFHRVWGGIGGFDGRGALGHGIMYCIDKSWWDAWVAYIGWSYDNDFGQRGKLVRPGELSTESLLDRDPESGDAGTLGSYELMKRDLQRDVDYVLVPQAVWDALYELYGGGPPLPRPVLVPDVNVSSSYENDTFEVAYHGDENADRPFDENSSGKVTSMDRVLKIPRALRVSLHPWILHVHLCDPQQPYRRGDIGPMTVRVMACPDQPLWRLFAEAIVRLPLRTMKVYGSDGRGRARLWKKITPAGPKDPLSRYGPWMLISKNRWGILPMTNYATELTENYDELRENWEGYADLASVEGAALADGDHIMLECATPNKNGEFVWPREAAAKAGRVRRLADEDMKFRQLLRGVDENGDEVDDPPELVGMTVDAMDSAGRWYQVEILKVEVLSVEAENGDDAGSREGGDQGESKQVKVDFTEFGGHFEWIDTESDRLATAGRFTQTRPDESPTNQGRMTNGNNAATTESKTKSVVSAKKSNAESFAESNGKVCSFPGYGACGLANLGNTCYINSAIQCISYMPLLRSYLLSAQYKATGDLNRDNPLGTGGKLLEEFADLLRLMWSARHGEKSPTRFRAQLGKARSQFSGADQQDAQEFLNYILDVLHEDSNKIRRKPYVEALEDDWVKVTRLPRVGAEAWRRFLRRNRSIMADVAMGQVLNTVTCPVCDYSSRSFDPFNLLSIPIPTVADVIFQCTVVRRATTFNCPWILNKPRKGDKRRSRFSFAFATNGSAPPSEQFVSEQYVIAMSRLADSGDLRLQIQNICGIPADHLRLGRAEEVIIHPDGDANLVVMRQLKVIPLSDKEGPCSQLAKQKPADDASAPPTQIVAFETTLSARPIEQRSEGKTESAADSEATADEDSGDDDPQKPSELLPSALELRELKKQLEVYGDEKECRIYDTDPYLVAKAVSRSLWPRTENELKLGLRVDAIDHRGNWFPGSVVELLEGGQNGNEQVAGDENSSMTKVRVHFDNFSTKWDELYTISHFQEGKVRPLYSHSTRRTKPTELIVHHRFTDNATRLSNLFGQSFYVQCQNEWSTARAGAHILAQATRFLQRSSDWSGPIDLDDPGAIEKDAKVQRLYERTHSSISDLIDLLVDCDREYIRLALGISEHNREEEKAEPYRNPTFDATSLSAALVKKVSALLHRLPFEVRVCTIEATQGNKPGAANEEVNYPFSLMRTIGNYMNARHAVVLQWKEPPSDKKSGSPTNYLNAPVMYVEPTVAIDKSSAEILKNKEEARKNAAKSRPGSGGLHLGVCLNEFCKVQQLSINDNWRCPRCKEFREGKQNLDLWSLPDLLTFHIKRFNCSARWREKISTKVNFPLTGLDMSEWCHQESPGTDSPTKDAYVYDLIGVMNHYGSMTGGHYVAVCKATACGKDGREEVAYNFNGAGASTLEVEEDSETPSGWRIGRPKAEAVNQNKVAAYMTAKSVAESSEPLWLQFDDDLVEPVPPGYVVSEMAYVLFYRRRRLTPSNIAKYSTLE